MFPFYGMTNEQVEKVLNNINTLKQTQLKETQLKQTQLKQKQLEQKKEKERLELMRSIASSTNPLSFSNLMLYSCLFNANNNKNN